MSSVVLAAIGLLISYTIQQAQVRASLANTKAQIDAAAIRAAEDRRFQESDLTAKLLQHLVSSDPAQRGIAIIALRSSVPPKTYDAVLEVLAVSDTSTEVRSLAIAQLGSSTSPTAATTLDRILDDRSRTQQERQLAAKSTTEISIRELIPDQSASESTIFAFAASGADEPAWSVRDEKGEIHGAFTAQLLRALRGEADANQDGLIVASEVKEFVVAKLAGSYPRQTPVVLLRGRTDIALATVGPNRQYPFAASYGVFVGTFPTSGSASLPEAADDARQISTLFNQSIGMQADILLNDRATRTRFLEALHRASTEVKADDLFVLYFSGHADVGWGGDVRWLFADSGKSNDVRIKEINLMLDRIRARNKVILVDTCHAGAIIQGGTAMSQRVAR